MVLIWTGLTPPRLCYLHAQPAAGDDWDGELSSSDRLKAQRSHDWLEAIWECFDCKIPFQWPASERLLLNHVNTLGFLAPGGEEFNLGPETKLDRSELLCNKGLGGWGQCLGFWDKIKADFPCGSEGKASVYNVVDAGSIPGLGRSLGEGNGNPFQVLLPGKSHGQRTLVDYI